MNAKYINSLVALLLAVSFVACTPYSRVGVNTGYGYGRPYAGYGYRPYGYARPYYAPPVVIAPRPYYARPRYYGGSPRVGGGYRGGGSSRGPR